MCRLVHKIGLEMKGCSNIDAMAPGLLKQWEGKAGEVHEFVTLCETIQEKRQVKEKLAESRGKNFAVEEEADKSEPARVRRRRMG
ncbi:MAG: hypothetical protein QXG97_06685 [Nitrososphaerota archaeon]